MVKTIYADILFLINFIINYLILFTSAQIGAARIKRLRLFLGAFVGAIYGVAVFFPVLSFAASFTAKVAFSVLIVLCAFGAHRLFRMTLIFLAVSLAFGGVAFALSLLGSFCEISNGVYYIHISIPALLLSSLIAYVLLSLVFRGSAARSDRRLSRVTISANESEIELTALHDTGNSLRDPSTNAPVVIADYNTLRGILPQSARELLDKSHAYALALDRLSDSGDFKLIPYKTVGVPFSLMLAYRPDRVIVDNNEIDGALVAISEHSVSDGGAYSALI